MQKLGLRDYETTDYATTRLQDYGKKAEIRGQRWW
jgi:hypothetical protein